MLSIELRGRISSGENRNLVFTQRNGATKHTTACGKFRYWHKPQRDKHIALYLSKLGYQGDYIFEIIFSFSHQLFGGQAVLSHPHLANLCTIWDISDPRCQSKQSWFHVKNCWAVYRSILLDHWNLWIGHLTNLPNVYGEYGLHTWSIPDSHRFFVAIPISSQSLVASSSAFGIRKWPAMKHQWLKKTTTTGKKNSLNISFKIVDLKSFSIQILHLKSLTTN